MENSLSRTVHWSEVKSALRTDSSLLCRSWPVLPDRRQFSRFRINPSRTSWSNVLSLPLVRTKWPPSWVAHPPSVFTCHGRTVGVSPQKNFLSPFPFRGVTRLDVHAVDEHLPLEMCPLYKDPSLVPRSTDQSPTFFFRPSNSCSFVHPPVNLYPCFTLLKHSV